MFRAFIVRANGQVPATDSKLNNDHWPAICPDRPQKWLPRWPICVCVVKQLVNAISAFYSGFFFLISAIAQIMQREYIYMFVCIYIYVCVCPYTVYNIHHIMQQYFNIALLIKANHTWQIIERRFHLQGSAKPVVCEAQGTVAALHCLCCCWWFAAILPLHCRITWRMSSRYIPISEWPVVSNIHLCEHH